MIRVLLPCALLIGCHSSGPPCGASVEDDTLTVRGTASLDGLNVSFDQTRSIADQRFDMKGDVNVYASYDAANQGRYGFHVRFANPKWPTHDGYVAAYDRFNDLSLGTVRDRRRRAGRLPVHRTLHGVRGLRPLRV